MHLVRLKRGDVGTEYHFHHQDEEWVYILSGRGIAEIGNKKQKSVRVTSWICRGFKTHAMRNPHQPVRLSGGWQSLPTDVCVTAHRQALSDEQRQYLR